jgi:glycosyltransferase involved in cell wall biosynthesis
MTTAGTPKVSIVTPSFNQVEFIEDTIQSVLDQTCPNVEYVIIDGGSKDGTAEIIKKYEDKLHYWTSEKDAGQGDAINKGFTHTSGEIMAWINSDDKYTPWALKVVSEIFSRFPHVNWIVGYNSWWNRSGEMTSAKRVPKNIYDYGLGNYRWIQQESVFWRRSLWEKAGGAIDTSYKLMVDGELWSRFFLHDDLYSVDCVLGGYRVHSSNRAALNEAACTEEMERIIGKVTSAGTDDFLKTLRSLRFAQTLQKLPVLKYLPVSEAYGKFVNPTAFDKARYKNIHYLDGAWAERQLPFSVRNS